MGSVIVDQSPEPSKAELEFEERNWLEAREAFKKNHKDKERVQQFLKSETTGSSVKKECLKLQDEADNKYHKSLGGILEKIDALMEVGDLAIKSAPESVGLAWMGVRTCLHAVQGDFATFQVFSTACADIVGIMISCRVYGKMYSGTEFPDDFKELHSQVIDYIPKIYTSILEFSYAVRKYTDKHVFIRIGKNIFKDVKSEFQAQMDDIQQHETKMRDFAKMATDRLMVHYQKEGLKNQDAAKADITFMRNALEANLKANDAFVRHIEALEEERKEMRKMTPYEKAKEEYQDNMRFLNPVDDQNNLLRDNLDNKREPGTCMWIFDLDEYKQWHDSQESSMVWVTGAGGYGKSILMSTVIEALQAKHSDKSRYVVEYFFCKAGNDATQTTSRILQSIASFIYASSEAYPNMLEKTNEIFKAGGAAKKTPDQLGSQRKTFNFEAICTGLLKAINRDVFLVIDAIDECNDRHEKGLLQSLRKVVAEVGHGLKIMVCSRPEPDIADDLDGVPHLKCEGHNEDDIRKNVTTEMNKFPGWTPSEKLRAVKEIAHKAGGQFRYVHIALNFLRKPLVRPYERALEKLPNGLIGSYITSWNQTDPDYLDLLKTTLTWAILVDGSVTVPEIIDAYGQTYSAEGGIQEAQEDAKASEGMVDLHDSQIRIAGGNFLEVYSSRHIALRHQTVRDFFLGKDKIQDSSDKDQPTVESAGQVSAEVTQTEDGHIMPNKGTAQSQPNGENSQKELGRDPVSKWLVSEKYGHLEIAKVLGKSGKNSTWNTC